MVVVAEWVTAADFLLAARVVCCAIHWLDPIACICIVVAVARRHVIFAAIISRNTEVSAPAIGALDVAFTTAFHRWAFHVDWMTEWTIVAVADLVVLTALRLLWDAPFTEASLHVAELVWLTLVIRLTGPATLVEGEAAQVWVLTDPVAVTWSDVHIALLREAGAFVWIAEVALWAVLLDIAGSEALTVDRCAGVVVLAVVVALAAVVPWGSIALDAFELTVESAIV